METAEGLESMKPGTLVRMAAHLRNAFRANGSRQHVQEFGGCVGYVVGLTDYKTQMGPDVDVRWIPSYLIYGYQPEDLVISRKKVRGWRKKKELARRLALLVKT